MLTPRWDLGCDLPAGLGMLPVIFHMHIVYHRQNSCFQISHVLGLTIDISVTAQNAIIPVDQLFTRV